MRQPAPRNQARAVLLRAKDHANFVAPVDAQDALLARLVCTLIGTAGNLAVLGLTQGPAERADVELLNLEPVASVRGTVEGVHHGCRQETLPDTAGIPSASRKGVTAATRPKRTAR